MPKAALTSGRFWLASLAVVVAAIAVVAWPPVYRIGLLGSGYMAQQLCAGLFVSGRSFEHVMAEDLSGPGLSALSLFSPRVDEEAKTVSVSAFGIAGQTAVFQEGLGCTLVRHQSAQAVHAKDRPFLTPNPHNTRALNGRTGPTSQQAPGPRTLRGPAGSTAQLQPTLWRPYSRNRCPNGHGEHVHSWWSTRAVSSPSATRRALTRRCHLWAGP